MGTKTTYAQKLQDPRWQKIRLQVLKRDKWKCKSCGEDKLTLHVHHKSYNGDPWNTELSDLKTLCKNCHSIIEGIKNDGGEIYNLIKINLIQDNRMYCAYSIKSGRREINIYKSDKDGNLEHYDWYSQNLFTEIYKSAFKTNKHI